MVADFFRQEGRYPTDAGVIAIGRALAAAGPKADSERLIAVLEGMRLSLPKDPPGEVSRIDPETHQIVQAQAIDEVVSNAAYPPARVMLGRWRAHRAEDLQPPLDLLRRRPNLTPSGGLIRRAEQPWPPSDVAGTGGRRRRKALRFPPFGVSVCRSSARSPERNPLILSAPPAATPSPNPWQPASPLAFHLSRGRGTGLANLVGHCRPVPPGRPRPSNRRSSSCAASPRLISLAVGARLSLQVDENGGGTKQVEEFRNLVQRQKVDAVVGYISEAGIPLQQLPDPARDALNVQHCW